MKIGMLALISVSLVSKIAYGALPPTAESLRHFKAIAESKAVYDAFGGSNYWIKSIVESEDGYLLKTDKCTLKVSVKEVPIPSKPAMVGKLPLEVTVGKLKCDK